MASFGWLLGSWRLLDLGLERQRGEKIELGRQARRHRQIEMTKGDPGQHAAAWRALNKTLLDQVRLDDLLDDVALVAKRRSYRLDPDWAAGVVFGNAAQVTPIHAVETTPINIKRGSDYQSVNTRGLYPAGEGAGYAGGILSAAIDGIEVAEAVALNITETVTRYG